MTNIYIEPQINMNVTEEISIIIHFKTQPAHSAIAIANSSGQPISLELAEKEVESSHLRFQVDIERLLGEKGIPFKIKHFYKNAFNGVTLRLPANKILELAQSPEVAAIYANKEYKLDPPILQFKKKP
jgi:hypothetical protein